jgi:hypothetical protein
MRSGLWYFISASSGPNWICKSSKGLFTGPDYQTHGVASLTKASAISTDTRSAFLGLGRPKDRACETGIYSEIKMN